MKTMQNENATQVRQWRRLKNTRIHTYTHTDIHTYTQTDSTQAPCLILPTQKKKAGTFMKAAYRQCAPDPIQTMTQDKTNKRQQSRRDTMQHDDSKERRNTSRQVQSSICESRAAGYEWDIAKKTKHEPSLDCMNCYSV